MPLPLAGVKVIDLSNVLAGPLATYILALLGADVLKVERPGTGDLSRKMGADAALGKALMGASYLSTNANKRSMTLNLQSAEGREVLKKLAAGADVVFENFRPHTMDKLGLGYAVHMAGMLVAPAVGLAVLEGDPIRAIRLAGAASALEEHAGIWAFPPIRERHELWLAEARSGLDRAAADAA